MSDTREQAVQPEQTEQQTPGAGAPGGGAASQGRPAGGDASRPQADGGAGRPQADGGAGNGAPGKHPGQGAGDGELAEIEGDLDELVKVGAQRDEYLALAQRTQADFENYRKRMARESALAHERGVAKLVKELLPALDNLDRALAAAASPRPAAGRPVPSDGGPGETAEDASLLQGVRLVREELIAALTRVGVESYSPVGERFDPAFHEAMAQAPVPGAASGTVAEVYQPGYRLGEDIIRPARVVVAA